jgi:hypothetical protein
MSEEIQPIGPTIQELTKFLSGNVLDEYGKLNDEKNAKIKEAKRIKDPEDRREAMERIRVDFQQKVKAMLERLGS